MNKKGAEISINVVIIAAIALIVLVVLVAIFTGRLGLFGKEVAKVGNSCTDHYSVDSIGTELAIASWQSECGDDHKQIYTPIDANEHPDEECCVEWESGASLRAR